ncbi:MAG: translation initiation factor IF-2 [bacterium]|nr:translation initiation factor IF-2 [bacterium]
MAKKEKENLITRPPIVVVLGHIDHGKSSLLEAIRDFKITAKESGGITQHIGAYQIEEQGRKITFIDTPGHEAFSQMRSRGAKVADIAILVIDASEGVIAQTKEVLSLVKDLNISSIVALNKIDKPSADPEKTKRELAKEDFLVESMGGKIPSIEISATTKKGIPELLDLILLVAEMEDLKASPEKPAQGVVVESYLDNQRGTTATLILTDGSLKVGDVIATPSSFTKVKSLEDFQKKSIEKALPSQPVIIFGFNRVPRVGEEFKVFPDLEDAEKYAQTKVEVKRGKKETALPAESGRTLNLILKADVLGSLEAIEGIFANLPQEKVGLKVLKSEVGNVNESDIKLALGNRALIIGFRVKADAVAAKMAEKDKVRMMTFGVIYELVEGLRKSMEKIAEPEEVRIDQGKIKVLAKFLAEKNRQIIGGRVQEGEIKKGGKIEVWRKEEKIGQGRMINLQRNKKDINSIPKGDECGILFEGDVKIEEGDTLVVFIEERRKVQI